MARRFVTLLTIVLAVAGLWSGGWFLAAFWLRGEIETAAKGDPALSCAELTIGGYPFRFDVTCTGMRFVDGDVSVSLQEGRATARIYMPTFVELSAEGPAGYEDAFSGAAYRLDWQNMQASVRLDGFALARASLVADGLVLNDAVLDVVEMARVPHAEFHAVGTDGATGKDKRNIRLFARFDKAEPKRLEAPLDAEISALVTEWPADVLSWRSPDLLPYWATQGGQLRIEKAEMTTGDLWASLDGTLAPDNKGLIDGSLTLNSRGFGPLMRDYLAAPFAAALLGPEDGTGTAHQTLVFSHSIMRAGIVPLLQLPPLF